MRERPVILVTGSSGTISTELDNLLSERGARFRALVRSDDDARDVREQGVEAAVGEFHDQESVRAALEGVEH